MKKQTNVFGTLENKLWETEKKIVSGVGGGEKKIGWLTTKGEETTRSNKID